VVIGGIFVLVCGLGAGVGIQTGTVEVIVMAEIVVAVVGIRVARPVTGVARRGVT
jgi:hypothetical protein